MAQYIVIGAFFAAALLCLPLSIYFQAHALVHLTEEAEKSVEHTLSFKLGVWRPDYFTAIGRRYFYASIVAGLLPVLVAIVVGLWVS